MTTSSSNLLLALSHLTRRTTRAMVSRSRLASEGLHRYLLQMSELSPGRPGALVSEPIIEVSRTWKASPLTLGELAPQLLSKDLVKGLSTAETHVFPSTAKPHEHQLEAWTASLRDKESVLVTAGTGAGKTECFLIPVLQDCLSKPRSGGGIRAILLYPLNALIESQRERLRAWAERLNGNVRFALFNGETPETERECPIKSDRFELRSRQAIRSRPPEILVTNTTMLEYLLLRGADRSILQISRGALRWIVLDEAHSYIGSQAAEMALLLRRVRTAFGVVADDVRLMATSATIGGEADALPKLRAFAAALAGQSEDRIAVIEGREAQPEFPPAGPDVALDGAALRRMPGGTAANLLAGHPRFQTVRRSLSNGGMKLSQLAEALFDDTTKQDSVLDLLDVAGSTERNGRPLLPWRAHLFHRAQGGIWACPDPECTHRAEELRGEGAGWPFGAVWFTPRQRCDCGAPVFEVVTCQECGTAHLQGRLLGGAQPRLLPPESIEGDDFALDAEPDGEEVDPGPDGTAWLCPPDGEGHVISLAEDGRIFDNAAPEDVRSWRFPLVELAEERGCCADAARRRLQPLRYGPPFLMGSTLSGVLEDLARPAAIECEEVEREETIPMPAGGRRALTFTDSRQGVARLAAKLQQESERNLTRAFLWHSVQSDEARDEARIAQLRVNISRMDAAGLQDLADELRVELGRLCGATNRVIEWSGLVETFAKHTDVVHFIGDIWHDRPVIPSLSDDPTQLAKMFLYRELFRRPLVQNNPETLGLVRLCFPELERAARNTPVPSPLAQAGIDAEGWVDLVQAALDMTFRQGLAVDMADWMVPLVAPRFGRLNGFLARRPRDGDMPPSTRAWPNPVLPPNGRMGHLVRLVYALTGGSPESSLDQDRTGVVLDALWNLISRHACTDSGRSGYRLDFRKAGVTRLDRAFLCPVTRRPYAYAPSGCSPNDPQRAMVPIALPRLPIANAGGLSADQREEVTAWVETDARVADLRAKGVWTDLHDRLVVFPPYVRAQEHSAQIPRSTLKRYEEDFAAGRINLLNCSTTMEMGVDLADVGLVVNSNVPPSLSSYRQRAGRAGRRGEPWAFTLTFCRDLPLDHRVFSDPGAFLQRPITAPKVWLESPALVQRHVNAALLSAWLGERGGTSVKGSIGSFMGAGDDASSPVNAGAPVDTFIENLDAGWANGQGDGLRALVRGTISADRTIDSLVTDTRRALETLAARWRREHLRLLEAAQASSEAAVSAALLLRAKRLCGEFLLAELARRGFTPAYGFPTDVVTFTSLGRSFRSNETGDGSHSPRTTASRSLDQAIREYVPGAEIVIDGLVYRSDGILPAWEAGADASGLEDLRDLWSCPVCQSFGMDTDTPDACPSCGHHTLDHRKILRPAGFVGATTPHVGYENLAHITADPIRISAQGSAWTALPEGAGRFRADPVGQVVNSTSGPEGGGFAICLDCGRAEPMQPTQIGVSAPLPPAIARHRPLVRSSRLQLTADGYCRGTDLTQRVQRNLHLAQMTRSDVWEWQMPLGADRASTMALAAALRDALTERLGVEPDEVVPTCTDSTGPDGNTHCSAFLYDRSAGGAGLSARMADQDVMEAVLLRAEQLLDCPEQCAGGCPACILRPDINTRDLRLDRTGGWKLAHALRDRLVLPEPLRIFGPASRLAGRPAVARLKRLLREGALQSLDVWLHGSPITWDLSNWPLREVLRLANDAGIRPRLHLTSSDLASKGLDLARKLALHGMAEHSDLYMGIVRPRISGHPVVMRIGTRGCVEALAVAEEEACPGPGWGTGEIAPAISGPAPELPIGTKFSTASLVEKSSGTKLLWPGHNLDGSASGFGKRFWAWLQREAPLEITAMKSIGVMRLNYTDRYLVTPHTIRLLKEVIDATPGANKPAVQISLAYADSRQHPPSYIHNAMQSDRQRRYILASLLDGADTTLSRKSDLTHFRCLSAELTDGRKLSIIFDQGLGSWRVVKSVPYDFDADETTQTRNLRNAVFDIESETKSGAPLTITLE